MNRLKTSQDPVQAASSKNTAYAYDAAGNLTTVTDSLNRAITMTYHARKELVTVKYPTLSTTSFGYDAAGNNITVTDARNNTTTYILDGENNVVSVVNPFNNRTTYVLDADNEIINIVDPLGNTTTITRSHAKAQSAKKSRKQFNCLSGSNTSHRIFLPFASSSFLRLCAFA